MNGATLASLGISCLCHRLIAGNRLPTKIKKEVRDVERKALAALAGISGEPLSKEDLQIAFNEIITSFRAAGIDYPTIVGWFNKSSAYGEGN